MESLIASPATMSTGGAVTAQCGDRKALSAGGQSSAAVGSAKIPGKTFEMRADAC
jgi:hypothetical protein